MKERKGQAKLLAVAAGLAALVGLTSCGGGKGLNPDTILFNGKIVTVDKAFSNAQAVAIRDGKFVAVGSDSEIKELAGGKTEMVDLEGKTVLPGFNDPHEHFSHSLGFVEDPLTHRFRNAKSIGEILDVVKEKASQLPAGEMVWFFLGPGSPKDLKEGHYPDRKDLDPVSAGHPVFLEYGGSGANASANSLALKKTGFTRSTPQPYKVGLNGEYVVDGSGELTGVSIGRAASASMHKQLVEHSVDTLVKNIKHATDMTVPYGITTMGDPMTNMSSTRDNLNWVRAYERISWTGEARVRANVIIRLPIQIRPTAEILDYLDNLIYDPGFGNDTVHFGNIKISIYDSTANFKTPANEVKQVIKAVHKAGWHLYIHTGGRESFDIATDGLEEAYKEFPRQDARHVITHARLPTDHTLEVLKKFDVMVEPQSGGLYDLPDDAEQRAEAGPKVYGPTPLKTYLKNGIRVMTGSDQSPIGPLFTIYESVNRMRKSGKVINPEERLTLEEAIRACTITPAYSTYQENLKGSIEVGKLADLVVLGRDILTVPVTEIKDIPVLRTMMGGKFTYTNPNKDPKQEVKYWYPTRGRMEVLNVPK